MSVILDIVMAFFEIIGVGVVLYGLFYAVTASLLDCDLRLAFCEKFGKSTRHLRGKVVFITGASSGIGENTALALAKHGVKLVLAARRKDELERVKRTCLEISKGLLNDNDVLTIQMDVTDLSSHQRVFDTAVQHFGTVDILFNNAGRSQRALWEQIDIVVDKQMFELNVFGVVNLSRVAINHFNKKGAGHVAVVSSITGILGIPFSASYTASKHAIHGYFDALRLEKLDKNIKVTLLCPGPTYTNFLQNSFTEREGEKYGISAKKTDKRLTGERCGELCAIALANQVKEAWMGVFPMMIFCYIGVYFPLIADLVFKVFGVNRVFKFRDSKDPVLNEGKDK